MLIINDLSSLVNVSENELILGGASLTVTADAVGVGDQSYADTYTDIIIKEKKNGKIKAKGIAEAIAYGDDYAEVGVDYIADGLTITKEKLKIKEYKDGSISARLKVKGVG
ncbi:MAG: hypothetical protein KME23_17435 [Goleter apudmare HA4340-LM2]|jgi:hypothetical protein|nr:hypothetical protein [Goleter apudmare HA4340-LM2]